MALSRLSLIYVENYKTNIFVILWHVVHLYINKLIRYNNSKWPHALLFIERQKMRFTQWGVEKAKKDTQNIENQHKIL